MNAFRVRSPYSPDPYKLENVKKALLYKDTCWHEYGTEAVINGCNDTAFDDHGVLKGDGIFPVKIHRQALKQEYCFPGVLCDDGDTPVNLLCQLWPCHAMYSLSQCQTGRRYGCRLLCVEMLMQWCR